MSDYGATGLGSHAVNINTKAKGKATHAEGYGTEASGDHSHSEGHGGVCKGSDSHVENHYGYIGPDTHASHVEGYGNTLSMTEADASSELASIGGLRIIPVDGGVTVFAGAHAEGMHCFAKGYGAHASGYGVIIKELYSSVVSDWLKGKHAIGRFNAPLSDTIYEVGIGKNDGNRKNGLEVYEDGRVRAPEQTIALHDDPRSLVTKEYFDEQSVEELVISEDNDIDFSGGKYFELTATAVNITALNIPNTPKEGVIIVHNAENITGWGTEFKFKNVPTDLSGDEVFAYFVENSTTIWIGRVV